MEIGGLFGVIILLADIFAIMKVLKSRAPDVHKILWIVVIALLPLVGLIIWYLIGPGDKALRL
jgi:hypothetical protein